QLGLYYLSSVPTDRAEPSEGLRATVAWQHGLDQCKVLLSSAQLSQFRSGLPIEKELDIRGQRGAYFVTTQLELGGDRPNQACWSIVANVNQDHSDVVGLNRHLLTASDLRGDLSQDVAGNQQRLTQIVSSSDGRQLGANPLRVQRHQSNVLFNVMRGGIPRHGYQIDISDFRQHVRHFNKTVFDRTHEFLASLGKTIALADLLDQVAKTDDADLYRIALEYLPFTYSRRHGDPTRPWNAFSIDFLNEDGSENLCYEGNWRDIFQNWEALSISFPDFASSMVFRFVNASTADGYNPYRLTKDGFEWEVVDPDDPWANIGYWGDHQIIYLLKLLECSRQFSPSRLDQWLGAPCCTYAQVPYRIRNYEQIAADPQNTIDYDHDLADAIEQRVEAIGADGKLLVDSDGNPRHVTLLEKLLVPALAKISNFVPGGGVWLNTQRPEWNDANNALVGNGLSMVTAYHLRRFFSFIQDWFSEPNLPQSVTVSTEVVELLNRLSSVLEEHANTFASRVSDQDRKRIVDALSIAGSEYRERLYDVGLSGETQSLCLDDCVQFSKRCLTMIDHAISTNRRPDGLYHSYNLLTVNGDEASIKFLYEMLEGQVAVLSSGALSPQQAVEVLDALRASKIYRPDQQSYMLYPDRELPRFLEKNTLATGSLQRSRLLQQLIADGDTSVVRQDVCGEVHFKGNFRNVADMNRALSSLSDDANYAQLVGMERDLLNELFEETFHHSDFTGRSGTFFAYEGLGSIYWHMVSKLALAVMENYISAKQSGCDAAVLKRLQDHYCEIRDGIGLIKTPDHYGAFPSDPYSHTPKNAGVQQPGMTGQVKEDILTRYAELGMRIDEGVLHFDLGLFESSEFLKADAEFEFYDLDDQHVRLPVSADCFAYTICQVPVVYHRISENQKQKGLTVHFTDGNVAQSTDLRLSASQTASLFSRLGEIARIDIHVDSKLCS
ncbi:MAG: hypothetical protein HKN47_08375, partial [Pirellulaceae bacterium]|nr:hypothetical protein [Pirellulaceae bacterium]